MKETHTLISVTIIFVNFIFAFSVVQIVYIGCFLLEFINLVSISIAFRMHASESLYPKAYMVLSISTELKVYRVLVSHTQTGANLCQSLC